MIKAVRQHLQPPNNNFWNIERNCYSYVPPFGYFNAFFRQIKYTHSNWCCNIRPAVSTYESTQQPCVSYEMKMARKKIPSVQRSNQKLVWSTEVFNFAEHNTFCNNGEPVRAFSHSIQTDGVIVSILMKKQKVRDVEAEDETDRKKRIHKKLQNNEYKYIVGNDPGYTSVAFFNT